MAVVVAARRTPIARLDGDLAGLSAEDLVVPLVGALRAEAGFRLDDVDDVILGNAAGPPGNLARRAALLSGLGHSTPGLTVDRQCAAGLEAILIACRMVDAGAAELVLAGGTESASTSPRRVENGRDETRSGRALFPRAAFAPVGCDDPGMAEAAEAVAETFGITRERQDAYAARSQARHAAAEAVGAFDAERVTCGRVTGDTCPRPRMTVERLARLAPLVRDGGTVTAGNSCPISDGAAMVAVCSDRTAAARGLRGLRLVDACTVQHGAILPWQAGDYARRMDAAPDGRSRVTPPQQVAVVIPAKRHGNRSGMIYVVIEPSGSDFVEAQFMQHG